MNFKSRTIFITGLLIVGFTALAYSQEVQWSPEFIKENGDEINSIIHDDGETIYMYVFNHSRKSGGVVPGILQLDKNLKPVKRTDFNSVFKSAKSTPFIVDIFYCKGKFFMLTYEISKGYTSRTYYCVSFDKNTMEPTGPTKELFTVNYEYGHDFASYYKISDDSSHFSVVIQMQSMRASGLAKTEEGHMVYSYDTDMNLKVTGFEKYDEPLMSLHHEYIMTLNDGSVAVFRKHYNSNSYLDFKKVDGKKVPNYFVRMNMFRPDGKNYFRDFDMKEAFFKSITGKIVPGTDELMLVLSYQHEGIINYEVSSFNYKTNGNLNQRSFVIPTGLFEEMKNQEPNHKYKKDNTKLHYGYELRDIVFTNNNDYYIIMERNYWDDVRRLSLSLLVFYHTANGEYRWVKHIPKHTQFNNLPDYLYASIVQKNDDLYLYFNSVLDQYAEGPINWGAEPQKLDDWTKSSMVECKLSPDGNLRARKISSTENNGIPVRTNRSIRGIGDRYIIFGWSIKQQKYKIGVHLLN